MKSSSPIYKWLQTQPNDFVKHVLDNERLGDETFTLKELRELDDRFNADETYPEDE